MNKQLIYQKKDIVSKQKEQYTKKSNHLSNARLILFLLFVVMMLWGIFQNNLILMGLGVACLIGFIILIIIHERIFRLKRYYEFCLVTIEEYLSRLDGGWKHFRDGGKDFMTNQNQYLANLDILGDISLFKYLTICKTKEGRKKLYSRLSNPQIPLPQLENQQQAMQEISHNFDFSLTFQATLKAFVGEEDSIDLQNTNHILQKPIQQIRLLTIGNYLLSLIACVILLLCIIGIIAWPFLIVVVLVQWLYAFIYQSLHQNVFENISSASHALISLKSAYEMISSVTFHHPTLLEMQQKIDSACLGITKMKQLSNVDSFRQNIITFLIVNAFLPLNAFVVFLYQRFQARYTKAFTESSDAFSELEVLTSLAILGQVKEHVCIPTFSDTVIIDFDSVYHPLLSETQCVSNSFHSDAGANIITGSNMSGKTSFLRTVGINLILMHAGAYVNGIAFTASYLKIFTSMRIVDDISRGISTFYAELLRIKDAIAYQKTGLPMVAFIDEVFKGTNSNDRIMGAISMIEKLTQKNVILFITTHDFELCEITHAKIHNYHFTEHYVDDKIQFDYKIKNGRCMTTNAKYLMKLAGITE